MSANGVLHSRTSIAFFPLAERFLIHPPLLQRLKDGQFGGIEGILELHRFLAAVKTLAVIRRLGTPVLQVNLAQQQTNIASAVVPVSTLPDEPEPDSGLSGRS